jgi:hypothetical protein
VITEHEGRSDLGPCAGKWHKYTFCAVHWLSVCDVLKISLLFFYSNYFIEDGIFIGVVLIFY